MTTVDQILQMALDLDAATDWERGGAPPELSPAVVTWLAQLALGHPQVSAAVAAALPSSGVRWGMPWSESDDGDATDVRAGVAGGRDLGRVTAGGLAHWVWATMGVHGRSGSRDAARVEVDERLIAAGYTLLGEVYRQAPVPAEPVDEMWEAAARRREARRLLAGPPEDEDDVTCVACVACGGEGLRPLSDLHRLAPGFDDVTQCGVCDGRGTVPAPAQPAVPVEPCRTCEGQGTYVFAGGDLLCGDCEEGRLIASQLGEPPPAPFAEVMRAEVERRAGPVERCLMCLGDLPNCPGCDGRGTVPR